MDVTFEHNTKRFDCNNLKTVCNMNIIASVYTRFLTSAIVLGVPLDQPYCSHESMFVKLVPRM